MLAKMQSRDDKIALLDSKVEDKFRNFDEKMIEKMQTLGIKVTSVDDRTEKIDKAILTVNAWARVIAWVLGIGVVILTGVLTGFFSKLLGI